MIFIHDSWEDLVAAAQSYETQDGIMVEVLKAPAVTDSFIVDLWNPMPSDCSEMHMDKCSAAQAKFANGNTIAQLEPISDHKQHQEEDGESDSEAFRVKRRRVLPCTRKRFQVDEQGLTSEKSLV